MEEQSRFDWPVIGHKNIISFLEASIKNDRVAHAYLFYGPSHLGKTTIVLKFIGYLLNQDFGPESVHPDVYWIKRQRDEKKDKLTKNISIKQIRELEQKLSLSSFLNSYKIAIIEEAETLSSEACDSLLKTLEEPTPKTVIILIAKNRSLPETILSRCQILRFLPVPSSEIYNYLISKGAGRESARNLSRLSLGRPGLACTFFEDLNDSRAGSPTLFGDYQEKLNFLIKAVNSSSVQDKFKIASSLISKDSEQSREALEEILNVWILTLRDLILIKNNCSSLISNIFYKEKIEELARGSNLSKILENIRAIQKTKEYISLNINPKLIIENLILNLSV